MKQESKRLNFSLPESLHEKVRKEAYLKKVSVGKIARVALEEYFARKK